MTLWGRREAVPRRTGRILPRIQVSFSFLAVVTLLLLADHRGIAAGALAASLLHECGHLGMLAAFGKLPRRVCLYGLRDPLCAGGRGFPLLRPGGGGVDGGPRDKFAVRGPVLAQSPPFCPGACDGGLFQPASGGGAGWGEAALLLARRYNRPALERGFEALSFICCLALLGIGLAVFLD